MNKKAELGSWVSGYFEGHPADYIEGGFVVRDGKGRRFIYSQLESPGEGLVTKMSLEWEMSDGGTFKPFGFEISEKEGEDDRVVLKIQVLHPLYSYYSGIILNYENNAWGRGDGVWVDVNDNLKNWSAKIREDVPVSKRFEYCVPVDIVETLSLWLLKLEDGDFSMPVIVPARTVMVEGFEWRAPYQERGSTFFPENTTRLNDLLARGELDEVSWGEVCREVMRIETAMRIRFLLEND